jgi:hypothetical protein
MQPPLSHFTSPDFWSLYNRLPEDVHWIWIGSHARYDRFIKRR